jgi:1-acyl-sn-glycerol-3-phosphate acyltransferase
MNHFILWFTKLTAIPVQFFFYRKKLYFENKEKQNTKIKGRALIVSNHISVYDYPLVMFTFFKRNIRVLIGEVMFTKNKLFSWFLKCLGGIKVNRDSYDFSFIEKSVDLLKKDKVVLIYPEARIPTKEEREEGLLEFKTSYIRIALESNSPIIPIYTNGKYGKDKKGDRARLIIGEKINVRDLYDEEKSEKENIDYINSFIKNKIVNLKINLERQIEGKNG